MYIKNNNWGKLRKLMLNLVQWKCGIWTQMLREPAASIHHNKINITRSVLRLAIYVTVSRYTLVCGLIMLIKFGYLSIADKCESFYCVRKNGWEEKLHLDRLIRYLYKTVKMRKLARVLHFWFLLAAGTWLIKNLPPFVIWL